MRTQCSKDSDVEDSPVGTRIQEKRDWHPRTVRGENRTTDDRTHDAIITDKPSSINLHKYGPASRAGYSGENTHHRLDGRLWPALILLQAYRRQRVLHPQYRYICHGNADTPLRHGLLQPSRVAIKARSLRPGFHELFRVSDFFHDDLRRLLCHKNILITQPLQSLGIHQEVEEASLLYAKDNAVSLHH